MKNVTLKSKLIAGGVLAAILPLVVVGLFTINKSSSALVAIAQGQAELAAQSLTTMVNLSMEQEIERAQTMASDSLIQALINKTHAGGGQDTSSEVSAAEAYLSDVFKKMDKNMRTFLLQMQPV